MDNTFLTTAELAQKLHYNSRYICNYLVDSVLFEGIHYFRPFGRRKILFIWEAIEKDMFTTPKIDMPARGAVEYGSLLNGIANASPMTNTPVPGPR